MTLTPTAPQRRPQISLALMLLLMSIFAVMSAGMFYASRVGAVQADLALLSQSLPEQPQQPPRRAQRATHLVFLMFTYTSPLLLAMLLSLLVKLPWFRRSSRAAS